MQSQPRPGECELETAERLARCQANKLDQIRRAREAGLLPDVPTAAEVRRVRTEELLEQARAAGLDI